MASAAQIEANRLNAAASCGPKTPNGRARSSRNHLKFGLFSTQNCVRPEETQEYARLSKALWKDLNAIGAVEHMLAAEIVRAAWRLHRCVIAEAEDGENTATRIAVDRARASAHASVRRPPQRPSRPLNVPRNAPRPWHSGLKYERYGGAANPPMLTTSRAVSASNLLQLTSQATSPTS